MKPLILLAFASLTFGAEPQPAVIQICEKADALCVAFVRAQLAHAASLLAGRESIPADKRTAEEAAAWADTHMRPFREAASAAIREVYAIAKGKLEDYDLTTNQDGKSGKLTPKSKEKK